MEENKDLEYIKNAPAKTLAAILNDDDAFVAAVIIINLEPQKACDVMQNFWSRKQIEIGTKIAEGISTSQIIVDAIILNTRKKVEAYNIYNGLFFGGPFEFTKKMKYMEEKNIKPVLNDIKKKDFMVYSFIRESILFFDDIVKFDSRSIQKILRETDHTVIAKALKNTSANVREKMLSNMTKKAAAEVKEDMEFMGRIRVIDAKEAQLQMLSTVHKLIETYEIPVDSLWQYTEE